MLKEVFISNLLEKVYYFTQHDFYPIGSVYMVAGMPKQRMACAITKAAVPAEKGKCYLNH